MSQCFLPIVHSLNGTTAAQRQMSPGLWQGARARADQGKKFVNSVNEVINMDWVSHKHVQNFIFIIEKDFFLNSSFI